MPTLSVAGVPSRRRLGAIAAVAACIVVGASGPVGAAGPTGRWGSIGDHHLRAAPALCRYLSTGSGDAELMLLRRIVVRPPVAFARSGTQTIGWRTRIQSRLAGGGSWETTIARPVQKATATTTRAAAFTKQSVGDGSPDFWMDVEGNEFRALVDIIWYRSGDPVGGATLLARPMAQTYDGSPAGSVGTCALGYN